MAWIMDTYSMHMRHTVTAVVTGKPVEMGGSLGRREATGRGCMIVTKEALQASRHEGRGHHGRRAGLRQRRLGRGGPARARKAARSWRSAIAPARYYNKNGHRHRRRRSSTCASTSTLEGFTGGDQITNEELLTLDVDVLLPAALENVITSKNAAKIRAKIICEGANGPTTAGADSILDEKEIFVIPDILANAGGVTVSYFEWVQDRGGYFWSEESVNERLTDIMTRSFADVLQAVHAAQGEHAHGGVHAVDQPRRHGAPAARHLRVARACASSSPSSGKPRDRHLAAAISEYETRAARYWPLEVAEVREASGARRPRGRRARAGGRAAARARSGRARRRRVRRAWRATDLGRSSRRWLADARDRARDVAFVIGGAFGLARRGARARHARRSSSRRGRCRTSSRASSSPSSCIAPAPSCAASRTTSERSAIARMRRLTRTAFASSRNHWVAPHCHAPAGGVRRAAGARIGRVGADAWRRCAARAWQRTGLELGSGRASRPRIQSSGAAAQRLAACHRCRGRGGDHGSAARSVRGPDLYAQQGVSALALADALERATGVPDRCHLLGRNRRRGLRRSVDHDGRSARRTGCRCAATDAPPPGTPMSLAPLGDLSEQIQRLRCRMRKRRGPSSARRSYAKRTRRHRPPRSARHSSNCCVPCSSRSGCRCIDASHDAVAVASAADSSPERSTNAGRRRALPRGTRRGDSRRRFRAAGGGHEGLSARLRTRVGHQETPARRRARASACCA